MTQILPKSQMLEVLDQHLGLQQKFPVPWCSFLEQSKQCSRCPWVTLAPSWELSLGYWSTLFMSSPSAPNISTFLSHSQQLPWDRHTQIENDRQLVPLLPHTLSLTILPLCTAGKDFYPNYWKPGCSCFDCWLYCETLYRSKMSFASSKGDCSDLWAMETQVRFMPSCSNCSWCQRQVWLGSSAGMRLHSHSARKHFCYLPLGRGHWLCPHSIRYLLSCRQSCHQSSPHC
jgi:hypothetical protein